MAELKPLKIFDTPHLSITGVIDIIKMAESAEVGYGPPSPRAPGIPIPPERIPPYIVNPRHIIKCGPGNKNYFIPYEARVPAPTGPKPETVIKVVSFKRTWYWKGEESLRFFYLLIEEPIERASKPTRSIPPAHRTHYGIPEGVTAREYRQRPHRHHRR